jgi:RNA polymerase sigma-70 factor (ECF subfamily)
MKFDSIYRKFRKPIFEYVKLKVKNPDVAEEVTQEIFFKAYRFQDSYDSKFQFSTWLWTIARNTISDFFRKSQTHPPLQEGVDGLQWNVEESPSGDLNPELSFIDSDERKKIFGLAKKLTRLQKRVLLMKIIHQFSNEEIAKKLNLSLSAVKSLTHRAKSVLSLNLELAKPF